MPSPAHPALARRIAALLKRPIHAPDNKDVREVVRLRANGACEYCLQPIVSEFEIDHNGKKQVCVR